jgi:hypothetical protein
MNRSWTGRWLLVLFSFIVNCGWIQAQINSWNSDAGGNWDLASSWTLGVPPGAGQSVFFTNAYWKAVVIDASTVSSAPQTLAVNSLIITSVSPSNGLYTTRNTLLLNYAQPGNALVIGTQENPGSFLVDSNSTVAMYYSGLIVNDTFVQTNSRLGEFQVDGNFIQSDNSEVVAGFLDLNGTYNMTNGQLYVGTQFINGIFNQQGGTNTGAIVVSSPGTYNIFDGAFNGTVTLASGGFYQFGGTVSAQFTFAGGAYTLTNGLWLPGDLNIGALPVSDFFDTVGGGVIQSGGTNHPNSLTIGSGYYNITDGVLNAAAMTLTTNTTVGGLGAAYFEQRGGYVTNGELMMIGGRASGFKGQEIIAPAKYYEYGGTFDAASIKMNFGNILVGGFGLNATNRIGTLSMGATSVYGTRSGAYVSVDQLVITNDSQFWNQGGTLSGAGNLTLDDGHWAQYTAATQLGRLQLLGGTNSSVYLGNAAAVLQFTDSSSVPWTSGGILWIDGWSGSMSGGGAQQILFGTSASGLTAQQLSQVQFRNPAGLPDGIYGAKILSTGEVIPDQSVSSSGPVNSWIKLSSGNWDDASSWSLGVLPNSSQTVLIANTNWKAVAINPSTPGNFPASMTVSNLFIEGSTNTENTLLLNNFGTATPLTVLNGLLLQNGAQIINLNSGLVLQGPAEITNSDIIQDGGFILATNGQVTFSGSQYYMSNGVFEASSVSLGFPVPSRLNQYGGSVKIASVGLGTYVFGTNDNGISLYGGTLELPGGMYMVDGQPGLSYFQSGGTNYCGGITMEPAYGGGNPGFTLNGGLMSDTSILVYGGPTINQNGGTHVITNSLSLDGESDHGETPINSTYNLNGGTLVVGTVTLNADNGPGVYNQSNGIAYVGEFEGVSEPYESYWGAAATLSGGTLACSNLDMLDSGTITQTGGTLIVSNTLTVAGFIYPGPKIYSKYYFTNGTLVASNINIGGNWFIGDSAVANRITNLGTCTLSNSLSIGNAAEQLGRFILAGTSTIDLSGSSSRLSFANSSAQAWAAGTMLVVSDWNGNASGGGVEQLKFGTDQTGLTTAQLNAIRFRISTNLYSAKILNTGEVVPDQQVAAPLTYTQQGNQMTLNWLPGYRLQSAPNPWGPYQNLFDPFITPPYTVPMNQPQQYFRIVPQ